MAVFVHLPVVAKALAGVRQYDHSLEMGGQLKDRLVLLEFDLCSNIRIYLCMSIASYNSWSSYRTMSYSIWGSKAQEWEHVKMLNLLENYQKLVVLPSLTKYKEMNFTHNCDVLGQER